MPTNRAQSRCLGMNNFPIREGANQHADNMGTNGINGEAKYGESAWSLARSEHILNFLALARGGGLWL
ncbi:unnamed protein product [Hymenolepis diminuta]|uniref:Maltoporin n=1 Tax=Hymenolepis diminuta TaxID=6216 RepID=A0A0R3SZ73_HYMDI|nr:unnamed protein product [Hymenolepis diminuta]